MRIDSGKLLLVIDLVGTFLFGVEGAAAAIANNLDLLGLMVLAFATALGGGIIRDLLKKHPFIAVLLGTITGVGGGTLRDVLLAQIPTVLRADVYATAALAGAVVMIAAGKLRAPPTLAAILGGTVCFLLRIVNVWQHWNLPKAIND